MPHHKHNPRTIVLPSGRAILLHRLSNSSMGIVGDLDTVGCIKAMLRYRFYTLDAGRITRKVREAGR
jgi:hypothetical protein